jgi:hypothetical protein
MSKEFFNGSYETAKELIKKFLRGKYDIFDELQTKTVDQLYAA